MAEFLLQQGLYREYLQGVRGSRLHVYSLAAYAIRDPR